MAGENDIAEALRALLKRGVPNTKAGEPEPQPEGTYADLVAYALVRSAVAGNAQALERILELTASTRDNLGSAESNRLAINRLLSDQNGSGTQPGESNVRRSADAGLPATLTESTAD